MANEKMKQSRLERQLSQAELARRVGASRQTVNMIESGDYNPTLALCIRICRELGKTLDELFWEVEDHV
jgi:putative transcriptional regulator